MFPAARVGLMKGDHRAGACPEVGKVYALLLDVAGEDEGANADAGEELTNNRRDSTALTVVQVDLSTVEDPLLRAPTYKVVQRRAWVGVKHARIYGEVRALAQAWGARYVVVDGTGVGAGLVSFLDKALPGRVLPFIFNQSTKSSLGWSFLGVVDTGRFKDFKHGDSSEAYDLQALFFEQLSFMQYEILPGPSKVMRWSVPDGTRNPATGELVHDDLVLSAALCGVLDDQEWSVSGPALVVRRSDPLKEMDSYGF